MCGKNTTQAVSAILTASEDMKLRVSTGQASNATICKQIAVQACFQGH